MRFVVVAAVLVSIASGCAGDRSSVRTEPESTRGAEVARYYPLAVGNRWTYQARLLGETTTQEIRIVDREGPVFVDSQGGRLTVDAFGIRDDKRYLLREPLKAGTSWTNVVSVSSIERYRIADVGFDCQSPAGRFQGCIRVEGSNRIDADTTLFNVITFAPGVGVVEVQTEAEVKGQRIPQAHLLLESYELAPEGSDGK